MTDFGRNETPSRTAAKKPKAHEPNATSWASYVAMQAGGSRRILRGKGPLRGLPPVVLFTGNWARLRGAAAMADGDRTSGAARQIFDMHVRLDRSLDSIDRLGSLLPRDRAVLRGLEALCLTAARAAMRDGHHTEGRRFGTLARQLRKLSEALPRQGDSGRG